MRACWWSSVSRWLADVSKAGCICCERPSPIDQSLAAAAHQESGAAYKQKKEQTRPITGHSVPGYDPGPHDGINFPDHTAERGHKGLPPPLLPQHKGELEAMSPSDGTDGSHGPLSLLHMQLAWS